jgi:uncharacterized membrane protein
MDIYTSLFLIALIIGLTLFFTYNIYKSKNDKNNSSKTIIEEKKCIDMRWGCCPDGISTKYDQDGTNCRGF